MSGSGKAIILAVGEKTLFQGEDIVNNSMSIDTETETPLQERLTVLATTISKFAYVAAFVIFVILVVYLIIFQLATDEIDIISNKTMTKFLNDCMVCIAILMVCVPEGMPLAVSIATAFSTDRLK